MENGKIGIEPRSVDPNYRPEMGQPSPISPVQAEEVKGVEIEEADQAHGSRKASAGGEMAGLSPGQPVRQKEVLLNVIHQGAPHFLHHLEDSLKVVKL